MGRTWSVGRSVGRSVDRSVGRSVDARAPVDHDSVGLAQARPNKPREVDRSITRQMMIIAGGEPELCRRRHAKRESGVYAPPYALRVRKSCPECSVHVLCLCRKV